MRLIILLSVLLSSCATVQTGIDTAQRVQNPVTYQYSFIIGTYTQWAMNTIFKPKPQRNIWDVDLED